MKMRVAPEDVRTIACIGAGVIGSGWVAHFLARGYDVRVWDPDVDAEGRVRRAVEAAWPALTLLGLDDRASHENLTFVDELDEATADADFVQESAPESLQLKIDLLGRIDACTPAGVVISSSTSGYSMTDMQVEASRPGRLIVGHPFNPPYLVPLVEVVGGQGTDPQAVEWASSFFSIAGKKVVTMDREVPGFIANRLQEALWREALHMLANDEATVDQIDTAITYGPGLRWAFHGPCTTFHLAGGEGGVAHALDHFGPSLEYPWTRLAAPPLTGALRQKLVDGCAETLAGSSIPSLIAERDANIVAVLKSLEEGRA